MAVVNPALAQSNLAALKRGSEHVHLMDSPRDKLRKSMSKRLVITTTTDNREEEGTLEFLRTTKVKDVPFATNFCSKTLLKEDDCIAKAIDSLLMRKIACAQVVRESDTVGIFDIGDLAVHCFSRFKDAKDTASEVVKLEEEFLEMPLKKFLVNDNWKSINQDDSLLDLMKLFTSPYCDRVIVKDDTSASIGILARSEFVAYIHKHKHRLNSKLNLHVKECQMSTISQTTSYLDSLENVRNAFNSLWLKQTSGLLASGSLMSSLRKFLNLIQYVHCTVQDNDSNDEDDIVVRIADTLEDVLDMMSERNTETIRVLDHSNSKYLHFYHVLQAFQPLTSS